MRNRTTWSGKSASDLLPIEEAARKAAAARSASAHPAYPDEGISHPAGYDDPKQPSDYENGDTSSWGEDPFPGPYRTSPAPAVPVDDGGYKHPATQPGAPGKNASERRAALEAAAERKAAVCIKIASAMLGDRIASAAETDKTASDMIEDQALDLMDLPDHRLASLLRRIEAATMDEETLLRKMLAAEGEEVEDDKKDDGEKKEASDDRIAAVMAALGELKSDLAAMKSGWGPSTAPVQAADDEEAMLASMLAEESMAPPVDDEEAMLAAMLAEEEAKAPTPQAPAAAPPEAPKAGGKTLADYIDEDPILMDPVGDPMGLGDDDFMADADEEILASLFASEDTSLRLAKDEEPSEDDEPMEDPKSEEDEDEGKDEGKTASRLTPRPRKASAAPKTLGTQTRTASSDMNDLEKLWTSAPDVTKFFGE